MTNSESIKNDIKDEVDTHEKQLSASSSNDSKFVSDSYDNSSSESLNDEEYGEKSLYKDLNSDEIQIKRVDTRHTIISALASQIHEFENEDNKDEEFSNIENGIPIKNNGEEFESIDPELIAFNGFNDCENPRNFSISKKIYIIIFASIYTLIPPMSSSILSPAMSELSIEFNINSPVIQAMVISIQILAWAFGPLIIAPLSEEDKFGRKLIMDISCFMSLFFNIGCAFSKNTCQMLIFRFLSGFFNSTFLQTSPAVVKDLFDANSRNVSLAGVFLLPLLGPVLAPVIGGYIVQSVNWRWVLYVLCIFNGVIAIVGFFFYKETYAPTILRNKAKKLRKSTGNYNLHTIYEISDNGESTISKMKVTITRPIKLLFTHPMVIGLGSFMAFIYGFMYLMIVTFPTIFGNTYGFDKGTIGLMYLPMGIGFIIGCIYWTYIMQKVYNYLTLKNNGVSKPEFRLPCLLINTGFLIPLSLLWYGWSVEKKLHWIMPAIGTGIFGFSFCCVFQTLQAILIDSIKFAASAVAAAAVFRSFFGFGFPLFANIMYNKLGYGWSNTIFAIFAIILGLPFPILLFKYGERIRNHANLKMDLEQKRRDERIIMRLKLKSDRSKV